FGLTCEPGARVAGTRQGLEDEGAAVRLDPLDGPVGSTPERQAGPHDDGLSKRQRKHSLDAVSRNHSMSRCSTGWLEHMKPWKVLGGHPKLKISCPPRLYVLTSMSSRPASKAA